MPIEFHYAKLALKILQQIKKESGDSKWLFPAPNSDKHITPESIDEMLYNIVCKKMGQDKTKKKQLFMRKSEGRILIVMGETT